MSDKTAEVIALGVAVIAVLAALGLLARWAWPHIREEIATGRGNNRPFWSNALAIFAIVAPVTVGSYLALNREEPVWSRFPNGTRTNYVSILLGVVVGAIVMAYMTYRLGHKSPSTANPRQYGELMRRWTSMDARATELCSPGPACQDAKIECNEVTAQLAVMRAELELPAENDPRSASQLARDRECGPWISGVGYVHLWTRLHEAEASLFAVQSREQVLANAFFDKLRLTNSTMPNSAMLLQEIDAQAAVLREMPHVAGAPADVCAERGPRLMLASIRRTINESRDENRYGLVATKGKLIATGFVTCVILYAVLIISLLAHPSQQAVLAASAFFTVGALVGLFNQLRLSSEEMSSGEDDFGLARTRVLYVPVLSGIAGLGGVLLIAMLEQALDRPLAVPYDGARSALAPTLHQVFNLTDNPFGFVVAAVFGLTPSLLIHRLEAQANQYKANLDSTSATAVTGDVQTVRR
jgi:hypothetical protein